MSKAVTNVNTRCASIDAISAAHRFLTSADEVLISKQISVNNNKQVLSYCNSVALHRAEQVAGAPSVSLVRLRLQESQYEQFLAGARQRLDAAEVLAREYQALADEGDDTPGKDGIFQ